MGCLPPYVGDPGWWAARAIVKVLELPYGKVRITVLSLPLAEVHING